MREDLRSFLEAALQQVRVHVQHVEINLLIRPDLISDAKAEMVAEKVRYALALMDRAEDLSDPALPPLKLPSRARVQRLGDLWKKVD